MWEPRLHASASRPDPSPAGESANRRSAAAAPGVETNPKAKPQSLVHRHRRRHPAAARAKPNHSRRNPHCRRHRHLNYARVLPSILLLTRLRRRGRGLRRSGSLHAWRLCLPPSFIRIGRSQYRDSARWPSVGTAHHDHTLMSWIQQMRDQPTSQTPVIPLFAKTE